MSDVVAVLSVPIEADPAKLDAALARVETQLRTTERAGARAGQGVGRGLGDGVSAGAGRATSALQGLRGALGAVGIGLSVASAAQFGQEAIASANALEKTRATLRAVAGSQERYNEILRIGQANQRLFGGSLQENLGPLQQFAFIANRTGASLEQLNQVAQLLAVVNPTEGIAGAGFSLSEALSGDLTSIVERFNLPLQAVRALLDESESAGEVLSGITALLAEQGVTAGTLSAALDTNAAAYDRLGAAASDATTAVGSLLAQGLAPVADGLATGLTQLTTYGAQLDALNMKILAGSGTYEAYRAQIEATNQQIQASYGIFGIFAGTIGALTPQAFAFRDALLAQGVGMGEANARAAQYNTTIQAIGQVQNTASITMGDLSAGYTAVADAALAALNANSGLEPQVRAIVDSLNAGGIAASDAAAQLAALTAEAEASALGLWRMGEAGRDAAGGVAAAGAEAANAAALIDTSAFASQAQAQALREASAAAYEREAADASLEEQARAAAAALADAGPAGAAAAAQLAGSSAQVDVLTAAFYRLEAAKRAALGGGGALGNLGSLVTGAGRATAADRALLRTYGAGPLALPRGGGGGGGGGGGSGGGGGGGASAAQRQAEQEAQNLARIAEQYHERQIDAERSYQERLSDIVADYARRRADAERSFADAQFSDRSSFYQSIARADKGQRTAMIQEYEAAQQRAAEIAQTVGADAGQAYLKEIAQIIRDRAQRQADIQKALEDGDRAEADFLRGVDQLARQDEQRRLDRATSGAGGLGESEAQARADAEGRRQDALAEAARTAGEAVAEVEAKKAGATAATNLALQTQLQLLDQIAQRGGGSGAAAGGTAAPATAVAAPAGSLPAGAAGGGPVAVTDAGLSDVLRRLGDVERAIRALGTRPNYTPGG